MIDLNQYILIQLKNSKKMTYLFNIQKTINRPGLLLVFFLVLLGNSYQAVAQEDTQSDAATDANVQANNPLASIKTFNLHNYYVPNLSGLPDATSNTMWLRYAQPIGRFLVRGSLPIPTVPAANQTNKTGLGDFNAFAAYLAVKNAKTTLGAGPLIAVPTATDDALGSGKWQGGIAVIIFQVVSPQLQIGGLITWQASFAGQSDRVNTNVMALQAFAIWQLGGGTYLRSTGISAFNLENGNYNVPFGMGIGKVLKTEKLVFNIFAEPQFTVLHYGVGQPKLQLFFGLNTQF